MVPPCAAQIARAIVSPSPLPLVSPRANSSKMRSRSGGATPGPSSETRTTADGDRAVRIRIERHDHQDLGAGGREPERILQQHDDDELEHRRVDLGEHLGGLLVETDPHVGSDMTQAVHRLPDQIPEIGALDIGDQCARTDATQLQHLRDESLEPVGLAVDLVEEDARRSGATKPARERSVDDAALIDDNGVRRLCVIAERKPARLSFSAASIRASNAARSCSTARRRAR